MVAGFPEPERAGTTVDIQAHLLKARDVALPGEGWAALRAYNAGVDDRVAARLPVNNASRAVAFETYGDYLFKSDVKTGRSAGEMVDGLTPLESSGRLDATAAISIVSKSRSPTIYALKRLKGSGLGFASTWGRAAAGALALSGAASCAGDRYAGVDLRVGAAPTEVQALARGAREGDKRAQFALGERYERGDGVARDLGRAAALYRAAATDSGGTRMMFVPRPSGAVSAVPVSTGAAVSGFPEARAKLANAALAHVRPSAGDLRLKHALDNLEGVCSFASPTWTSFRRKRVTLVTGRAGVSNAALAGWPSRIRTNYAAGSYIVLSLSDQPLSMSRMGEGLVQRAIASGRLSQADVDCFSLGTFRGIIIIDAANIVSTKNFSKLQAEL